MRGALFAVGVWAGLLLAVLLSTCARAGLLDLRDMGIDYKNYAVVNPKARNSLIYPEAPKEGVNLLLNMDVLTFGYWDNTVETLTTDGQYRSIGLLTRLGVRVTRDVHVGYEHHSQHLIDRHHSYMHKFPVEDAVTLRIYLFQRRYPAESVF